MTATLRIGTRGSALALAQARAVAALLGGAPAELVVIATAGDYDRARGDKSRWVSALEDALLAGDIDLAVHSAKDVPGELAAGTVVAATPLRGDPYDVLVGASTPVGADPFDVLAGAATPSDSGAGDARHPLDAVPLGARVGTSALRRRAQLLAARPDLELCELRGNVDTRLVKRAAGEVDVLVLAAAGLERLGRRSEGGVALSGDLFVPAPGQGIIAVQARAGSPAAAVAASADDRDTHACLDAERAAVRILGASCRTPVGVLARDGGTLVRGFAGLPDGSAWVIDEAGSGEALARRMLAAGAGELLREAEALAR